MEWLRIKEMVLIIKDGVVWGGKTMYRRWWHWMKVRSSNESKFDEIIDIENHIYHKLDILFNFN